MVDYGFNLPILFARPFLFARGSSNTAHRVIYSCFRPVRFFEQKSRATTSVAVFGGTLPALRFL